MTPQDYAVLKPGLADSLALGTGGGRTSVMSGAGMPGGLSSVAGSGLDDLGLQAGVKPPFAAPAPRENPYLQTLTTPEPAVPTFAPTPKVAPMPPSPMMPRPVFGPPPATPPPQSTIPDFAKPSTNEKYFRPQNRF
jgi:hypothetical protein